MPSSPWDQPSFSAARHFNASAVYQLLDLDTAYSSQLTAFRCLGMGLSDQPDRLILTGKSGDATGFCYAARLRPGTGAVCKFGAVAEGNAAQGMPVVHANVLVLDATTGMPTAVIDGRALTERRTAAASAVAVDALAATDATRLAILGCGVQGRAHTFALLRARTYQQVRLWSRNPGRAAALKAELASNTSAEVLSTTSARECVESAHVVITCTTSVTPVLSAAWLAPGATVISIGCFDRDRCEVGVDLVRRADRVVVDHLDIALDQAGPIVAAVAQQVLSPDWLVDLGQIVTGARDVRKNDREIIFYNSVGIGVQDAAAAHSLLSRADLQ